MSDSDLDKKRNKLGYQRISIACGRSPLMRAPEHASVQELTGANEKQRALTIQSPLPSAEDQMPRRRRRPAATMSELHSAEEGVCVLPCGTTDCNGKQITALEHVGRRLGAFVCGFCLTANEWDRAAF